MLIYSSDKKSVVEASMLQVQRNIGGGKDGKYMIIACSDRMGTAVVIAATFPDEKTAVDALEKAFGAFSEGASSYRF